MKLIIAKLDEFDGVMEILYDVSFDDVAFKMEHHQYKLPKSETKKIIYENGVIYWYIGEYQYCAMDVDFNFPLQDVDRFIFDQLKPLIREQKLKEILI